jgi:hypothetical protein
MGRNHPRGANGGVYAIFREGALVRMLVAAAVGHGRSRAGRVVIERGIDVDLMAGPCSDAAERDATN